MYVFTRPDVVASDIFNGYFTTVAKNIDVNM